MSNGIVIGSGLSGLSAACFLAKSGMKVTVLEKNDTPGGRVRQFQEKGYTFDMGPSWYWMPEVFERFYGHFGKKVSDFYTLKRLDPSYRIFFPKGEQVDIPAGEDALFSLFERFEKGSSVQLRKFLSEAAYKYKVGTEKFVFQPGLSVTELIDKEIVAGLLRLHLLKSMRNYVNQYFKHPYLRQILEFPVLFLGATPQDTPALYSMMNHADLTLGTWYPMGGMYKIIEAMTEIAQSLGVKIVTSQAVEKVEIENKKIRMVYSGNTGYEANWVVNGADYHHFEQEILPESHRTYSEKYWDKRVLAPSCLLYYVGVSKKIPNLLHHNLFFDGDFDKHAEEIYTHPEYPANPLFYVSCTSKTDHTAPEGHENLFILVPVAVGLTDSEAMREKYFNIAIERMEKYTGEKIQGFITYKRSFAQNDFIGDYNSYKGNAYGLANTLLQTANLKPSIKSRKIDNLYYTGHLTVPGPGMPPAMISGEVVANQIIRLS